MYNPPSPTEESALPPLEGQTVWYRSADILFLPSASPVTAGGENFPAAGRKWKANTLPTVFGLAAGDTPSLSAEGLQILY